MLGASTVPALPAQALLQSPAGAEPRPVCTEVPDPSRWEDAATPDEGAEPAVIAVHRGAANLVPENTIEAYRYAIAYDVEMIEVDVQQTVDGRFVAFHDTDLDGKTDGSGPIALHTYDQVRALNAADNDRWRSSAYDPAQIPSLEEILALARDTGTGVMFDRKESVTDLAGVSDLAAAYDVLERSVFIPYLPGRAEAILAAQPAARLTFSNQLGGLPSGAPTGSLYALTAEYSSFGSSLTAYDAGDIAEIHDGCSVVLPNVYQGSVTGSEAGDLRHARALGADGAQVNNPDVAVAVLGRPVATAFQVRPQGLPQACLVGSEHQMGLPGKQVSVGDRQLVTGPGWLRIAPGRRPRRAAALRRGRLGAGILGAGPPVAVSSGLRHDTLGAPGVREEASGQGSRHRPSAVPVRGRRTPSTGWS